MRFSNIKMSWYKGKKKKQPIFPVSVERGAGSFSCQNFCRMLCVLFVFCECGFKCWFWQLHAAILGLVDKNEGSSRGAVQLQRKAEGRGRFTTSTEIWENVITHSSCLILERTDVGETCSSQSTAPGWLSSVCCSRSASAHPRPCQPGRLPSISRHSSEQNQGGLG